MMDDLALVRISDNAVLQVPLRLNDGWVDLPNGSRVSPAVAGWEGEGFRILEAAPAAIPEGKTRVEASSHVVDGNVVREIPVLGDIPPPQPPDEISDRQFAQGLAVQGVITEAEAEEWVGPGTVPAALLAFVAQLPAADQFPARMLLRGATIFRRSHPLTATFSAANGWTDAQTDAFWWFCSGLD
jgi:hypothetical protein